MVDELIKLFAEYAKTTRYTYVPYEYELPDGVTYVDQESLGSGRWMEHMQMIVEYKGQLFAVEWDSGLTEMQDNDFHPDKSSIYPVERKEKVVYTYKKIKQNDKPFVDDVEFV